jgi:hypothetical protein
MWAVNDHQLIAPLLKAVTVLGLGFRLLSIMSVQ